MHKRARRKVLNEQGYTLIESIFQLMVYVVFSSFFILLILWTTQFQNATFAKEQTEWELFVQDLLSYIAEGDLVQVINEGSGIRVFRGDQAIDIEKYEKFIRKQVNELGHEPMLTNVKTVHFILNESYLTIQVEFENGIHKERQVYVPVLQK